MTLSALIWDLDGTLLDTYPMIVGSLRQFYAEQGLPLDAADISDAVLRSSVRDFAAQIEAQTGISLTDGMPRYRQIRAERELAVTPMPGARETLARLRARGVPNFIFTHRGASTQTLLDRTELSDFFSEIVTAEAGFPRKPAPDGLRYLVEQHGLDPARTAYLGDREIDMRCAENAGLCGILLRPAGSPASPLGSELAVIERLDELPI